MNLDKRTVAKALGAGTVGFVGGFIVKQAIGRTPAEAVLAMIMVMFLHETFNAPVSNWIYKQL